MNNPTITVRGSDAGSLLDELNPSTMNPRVKAAGIGGIVGFGLSVFLSPKHKVIGFAIGAGLGALYSQKLENAAVTGTASGSASK